MKCAFRAFKSCGRGCKDTGVCSSYQFMSATSCEALGQPFQSSLRMVCTCRVNTFYTLLSNKLSSLVYACISIKLIQKEPHTTIALRTGPRPRWTGLMERLPEQQVRLSQTLQMQAFSLIYRRKLNQILPGWHHKGRRVVNIRTRFQVLLMLRCVQTYGRLRVS